MSNNISIDFAKIWGAKIQRIQRLLNRLPRDIGNEAVLFFNEQFKKQENPEGEKWKERKKPVSPQRNLLVQSGRLRRSIRLLRSDRRSVTIGSQSVPYAQYHNDGGKHLPQRKFIGASKMLNRRLYRLIEKMIKRELMK